MTAPHPTIASVCAREHALIACCDTSTAAPFFCSCVPVARPCAIRVAMPTHLKRQLLLEAIRQIELLTAAVRRYADTTQRIARRTAELRAARCVPPAPLPAYDALSHLLAVVSRLDTDPRARRFDPGTGTLACHLCQTASGTSGFAVWCTVQLQRAGMQVSVAALPAMFLDEHALAAADSAAVCVARSRLKQLRARVRALFDGGSALALTSSDATMRLISAMMCGAVEDIEAGAEAAVADWDEHVARPASAPCFDPSKAADCLGWFQRNALPEVYDTVVRSARQRHPQVFDDRRYDWSRREAVAPPETQLTLQHLGCECVSVDDDDARDACLQFVVAVPSSVIALDAEWADGLGQRGIDAALDVIQLGTNRTVFLIYPKRESGAFLRALRSALRGLTVLYWGSNDVTQLETAVGGGLVDATCVDVQTTLFGGIALHKAVQAYTDGYYTMGKAWTRSGWDVHPLAPGQREYAALDVALPYVMWWSRRRDAGQQITCWQFDTRSHHHAFMTAHAGAAMLHGFAYTAEGVGHYESGTRVRGFVARVGGGACLEGFRLPGSVVAGASLMRNGEAPARRFVRLLNDCRLCCAACTHAFRQHAGRMLCRCASEAPSYISSCTDGEIARYCLRQLCAVMGERAPLRRIDIDSGEERRLVGAVHHDLTSGCISATLTFVCGQ